MTAARQNMGVWGGGGPFRQTSAREWQGRLTSCSTHSRCWPNCVVELKAIPNSRRQGTPAWARPRSARGRSFLATMLVAGRLTLPSVESFCVAAYWPYSDAFQYRRPRHGWHPVSGGGHRACPSSSRAWTRSPTPTISSCRDVYFQGPSGHRRCGWRQLSWRRSTTVLDRAWPTVGVTCQQGQGLDDV